MPRVAIRQSWRGAVFHRRGATGPTGTHFRVWAPAHRDVALVLEDESGVALSDQRLDAEPDGYFSLLVPEARAGLLYRYRFGQASACFPDPASRFQPFGPHGPSQVVDPTAFTWGDSAWRGVDLGRQVLYEMHVGTFTAEGTWTAALEHLPELWPTLALRRSK